MGKRRHRAVPARPAKSTDAPAKPHDHEEFDANAEGFYKDEVDRFHEGDKMLLDASGNENPSDVDLTDSEEEVMGLDLSESELDDENKMFKMPDAIRFYASDDEFQIDEDEPEVSEKAWGHSKKVFYSTDYVDDELGRSSDEENADMELKEVIALEQRMAAELDEQDFDLPVPPMETHKDSSEKVQDGEVILQDFSNLSKEEKLALLEKDSPELFELLEELKEKMPKVTQAVHETSEDEKSAAEIQLYSCYCLNIMFYLWLKSLGHAVHNHPVVGRIVEIRKMISELTRKHTPKPKAKRTVAFKDEIRQPNTTQPDATQEEVEEDSKRAITYEIARNKGLTPKRKKEQRNPRVRHRKKFEKAKIKRKSQVPTVVREQQQYGGERSGIRSNLARSVKIK